MVTPILDGYNLLPAFKGEAEWPRKEFIYWTDGGSVAALRHNNWKFTFLRQDAHGIHGWIEPFTALRAPVVVNLRMDPMERAQDESSDYNDWMFKRMFTITPAVGYLAQWMQTFREFPPRMKPGSFNLDQVMETATKAASGK